MEKVYELSGDLSKKLHTLRVNWKEEHLFTADEYKEVSNAAFKVYREAVMKASNYMTSEPVIKDGSNGIPGSYLSTAESPAAVETMTSSKSSDVSTTKSSVAADSSTVKSSTEKASIIDPQVMDLELKLLKEQVKLLKLQLAKLVNEK